MRFYYIYISLFCFILRHQLFLRSPFVSRRKRTALRKQDPFFLAAFHFPGSPLLLNGSRTLSDEPTVPSINHGNAARSNFAGQNCPSVSSPAPKLSMIRRICAESKSSKVEWRLSWCPFAPFSLQLHA